ncbi:ferredoxin family protein [Melioribacteraceae bacterium 4301-Me]|uniref:4Fe-4S dicluster domain-containing protein n=1 Tax=Pyranulibacter aquaticus TaxID=3163344 RepID=UPI003595E688
MAKVKGDIIIDIEKCKGCELCTDACPQETLGLSSKLNSKGYHYVVKVKDNCTGCINCALVCPEGIIKVFRKTLKKIESMAATSNVNDNITFAVRP